MFENIGEKVKGLAVALFSIVIVIVVLVALYWLAEGELLACILTLVFGIGGVWVSSIMIYAFGELVDNSSKTVSLLQDARYMQRYGINENSNDEYDEKLPEL